MIIWPTIAKASMFLISEKCVRHCGAVDLIKTAALLVNHLFPECSGCTVSSKTLFHTAEGCVV